MTAQITREAALRLGIAARELDGLSAAAFAQAVGDRLGLPLTETRLAAITVTDLREILAGNHADSDMPGSIRAACASNTGEVLDGHFGSCERFLIYQLSSAESRLIAIRPTLEADHAEDRNAARGADRRLRRRLRPVDRRTGGGQGGAGLCASGQDPKTGIGARRRRASAEFPAPSAALAGSGHGGTGTVAGEIRRNRQRMTIQD